jgi:hypothetical protein
MIFVLSEAHTITCHRTKGPGFRGFPCDGRTCGGLRAKLGEYKVPKGGGKPELPDDALVECIYTQDDMFEGVAKEKDMDMTFRIKLYRKAE